MRSTLQMVGMLFLAFVITTGAQAVYGGTSSVARLTLGSSVARSEASNCGRCHPLEYSLWITHSHSRALLDPENDKEFIEAGFSGESAGYHEHVDGVFGRTDVAMAFGTSRVQVFWQRTRRGHELLPAMWRIEQQRWEPLPPFMESVQSRKETWEEACAGCHASGFDPSDNTFGAPAVSCRACHGDGAKHVASGGLEAITRPSELSAARRTDLCGVCHARGTQVGGTHPYAVGYQPGTPLSDALQLLRPEHGKTTAAFWPDGSERTFYMEYQGFIASKHFAAGLSCTTCHLPHGSSFNNSLRRHSDTLCTSCHDPDRNPTPVHTHHPGNAASCVDCHMSVINPGDNPFEVRTHQSRFLEPANAVKWNMPDSCTSTCHGGRDAPWAADIVEDWRR